MSGSSTAAARCLKRWMRQCYDLIKDVERVITADTFYELIKILMEASRVLAVDICQSSGKLIGKVNEFVGWHVFQRFRDTKVGIIVRFCREP